MRRLDDLGARHTLARSSMSPPDAQTASVMTTVVDDPTIGDATDTDTLIDSAMDNSIDTIDTVINDPVVGETDAAADEVATRQKKRFNNEDLKGKIKQERRPVLKWPAGVLKGANWPAGRVKSPGRVWRASLNWPAGRLKRPEGAGRWFPILL